MQMLTDHRVNSAMGQGLKELASSLGYLAVGATLVQWFWR